VSHGPQPFVHWGMETDTYQLPASHRDVRCLRTGTRSGAARRGDRDLELGTGEPEPEPGRGRGDHVLENDPGAASTLEQSLLERACIGDDEALDLLCRSHWICVYRLVSELAHGGGNAEEITQEVFARAIAGLPAIVHAGPDLCSCLVTIASWLVDGGSGTDYLSQHVGPGLARDTCLTGAAVDFTTCGLGGLMRRDLVTVLPHLPESYRELLRLRFVDGIEVGEVAAIWGRSPEVVHEVELRALAALRAELTSGEWE